MRRTRPSLFDYGEAEEKQYDMVDAITKGGSMLSGLNAFYMDQDEQFADKGGFWGQFGTTGTKEEKPEYDLNKATQVVKDLTGDPKKALQDKISKSMAGDYSGMTDNERWAKQSENWMTQNTVEAVAGKDAAGLLGAVGKIPGVGDFMKKMQNKAIEKAGLSKLKHLAGPVGVAMGIGKALGDIKKQDDQLAGVEHDVGVAGKAINQDIKGVGTDLHASMTDAVNRVKEGGSALANDYGATALKVLSREDKNRGDSNLLRNEIVEGGDQGIMNNLITQRLEAGSVLKKQANAQMDKSVNDYTSATGGLMTELMKNRKLGAEIEDQRDQLTGITNIAGTVVGGLV